MPLDWKLINQDVLSSVNLEELVRNVDRLDCSSFGGEVSRAAREEGRWTLEQRECLRFINAVLTMMLRPDQLAEPYGPLFEMNGRRGYIPSDFDKEGLRSLEGWAQSLKDPELRARFLDVLWVQARCFTAAKGAVDAYIASALRLEHPEEWTSCHKRLERALRLAAGLGKGGAELLALVLEAIEAMVHRHQGKDPLYLTMALVQLLLEFKHGDANQYSAYARVAASSAEAGQAFWRAKDYYQLAAECNRVAGDVDGETMALRSSAECLVKEAELAYTQPGRGARTAAAILSDAVEAMRQIPDRRERATELHAQLISLQKEVVEELKEVSTSMDVSELVQGALDLVRGKSLRDAVFALCAMAKPPSIAKLLKQVRERARIEVLGSMAWCQVVNSRGQVVAIAPGLEAEGDDPSQPGLRWRMFSIASEGRSLTVQAMLNPARLEIYGVHSPNRQDIAGLIQHSPWIPPGHAESVVRALVAGFDGDMILVGHLVPPQLEAMIRYVVESRGGATSKLEPGGVQPERSLGPLLETPEALEVFGADGVFELQDLFTEQLGTNLRNEVAHGLLDDSGFSSSDVLYAWWLLLRYCVLTSKTVVRHKE